MILLIVWDGLRPDLVSAETTPYLFEQTAQGVRCTASHAVLPTATRINAASLATGCYPGRHGIVDNELYVPAIDAARPVSCADWRALRQMADLEGERLLSVPTLGEHLQQHGLTMVTAGSGSPGTTYLNNPETTGPVLNWAVAWPEGAGREVAARYGGPLPAESTSSERNRFVLRGLTEWLVPELAPDVVTVWLTEPDHMQHAHGIGSPEALAMLRENDAALRDLIDALTEQSGGHLTTFLLSDHGFTTISEHVDPDAELVYAGFKASLESTDIVRGHANSLYLDESARQRLPELVAFLADQPWIGALLVRDDLVPQVGGAMPQSAAMGNHRRSADILFGYQWDAKRNAYGIPGRGVHPAEMAAIHGSASPYALRNTLIAWGEGIKRGVASRVPCCIVDLAPTVMHLLGLAPGAEMQGRVLRELLTDGPHPDHVAVTHSEKRWRLATEDGTREEIARYSHAAGSSYLNHITMPLF